MDMRKLGRKERRKESKELTQRQTDLCSSERRKKAPHKMAKITKEDGREGDTRRLQEGEGDRKDREEGGITGTNPREEWRIGENDLE